MSATDNAPRPPATILVCAVWLGLVCGLGEGAGLLALPRLGWMNWNMAQMAVSREILWIAPLFDVLLFVAVGLLFVVAAALFPQLPVVRVAVGTLSFLLFLNWLAVSGRIRHSGVLALAAGLGVVFSRWYKRRENAVNVFLRRALPWVIAVAVLTGVGIEGEKWFAEYRATAALPAPPAGAPNVLVIVVDTLRADHLSSYGYHRPTSPHLDAVAQEGALFESAIATSSWTLPSHASLLTGRYAYEHGATYPAFDGRYPTLAEVLKASGYRTGAFSANTFFFSRLLGFGHGFIRFEDYFHSWEDRAARTVFGRKVIQFILYPLGFQDIPGRKLAEHVTHSTLDWISRDSQRPFFAMLNYFDAHDPYLPPQPWRRKFSRVPNAGGILNSFQMRYYPNMTPEQFQGEIDAYDGAVAYVDDQIGRLLDGLQQAGLLDSTIVVITSDHGEMFGEHDLLLHRNCLYRPAIHVPLIIRWPGRVAAGARIAQPVSIASLPATLVEMVSAVKNSLFPGPSLVDLWQPGGPPADWPDPVAELEKFPFERVKKHPAYHGAMKSLVSPQWHFIEHEKFGFELYDWANDPSETTNLANTPLGRTIAEQAAAQLRARLAQPRPLPEPHPAPSAAKR